MPQFLYPNVTSLLKALVQSLLSKIIWTPQTIDHVMFSESYQHIPTYQIPLNNNCSHYTFWFASQCILPKFEFKDTIHWNYQLVHHLGLHCLMSWWRDTHCNWHSKICKVLVWSNWWLIKLFFVYSFDNSNTTLLQQPFLY